MKNFRKLNNEYYKLFILIYVFQLVLLVIFLNNNYMQRYYLFQTKYSDLVDITIGVVIFIFNIISIFIIRKLYLSSLEAYENKINQLKLANVIKENKAYRKYQHDFKNHLNVIYELAREGDLEKLNGYLLKYIARVDNALFSINVGVKEIDVLLHSKIISAQNSDINIKFNCSTNLQCHQKYILDLVSIIGNLMDNAIEACCQLESDRKIEMFFKEDPLDYIIEINNTFKNTINFDIKQLFKEGYSTKAKVNRGEGLYIVEKTIRKFNGNISIWIKDNKFYAKIEIPKYELED